MLPVCLGWALPLGAAPTTATVCLRDSQGSAILGAEAFVSAGGIYVSLGSTDATGCVSTDLPSALGNRTFRISHLGLVQNKTQNTSTNPNVIFQTVAVKVRLFDSAGIGILGAPVEYNNGAWQSLGVTDVTGTFTTELLGINTNFRVTHRGLRVNKSQNTATNPNVIFQTVPVTVRLQDSTGAAGISGAGIEFNGGTWQSLGATDATGTITTELLGLNTSFRVTHRGLVVSKSQNTATNPNVVFQTMPVTVRLLDSTGAAGISGAGVEFNGGTWQSLGSTDAAGMVTAELLGLNTTFRLTRTGQTQNKSQNTSTNPNVIYQTGRVLQGTGARVLAWSASGWHPFVNGVELLPGNVTFDFNTGPNKAHVVVAGATNYVPVAPTDPVVTASDQSASEGLPFVLGPVSFADLEAVQTHRATIDWGDGSAPVTGVVVQANGLAGTVGANHLYADDGSYTVEVCVSDDGNPDAEGCDTLQVTVANIAPQVTLFGIPGSGEEGTEITVSSLAADTDPLTFSWTVSLAGTTVANGSGSDIAFTPADDGVYEVALTADDGDGGTTTASGQITIVNVAPSASITGAPPSAVEGDPVTLGSDVSDAGANDSLTYAWTVAHDGSPIATGSNSGLSFTPDAPGWYQVTLIVSDDDGAMTSVQLLVVVEAAPQPPSEPEPAPEPGPEPAPGPESEPQLEPAPQSEPEPSAAPEPPAAEDPAPAGPKRSEQSTVSNTGEVITVDESTSDPALADEFPASAPEAAGAEESASVFEMAQSSPHPDQVMLLALIDQPTPAGDVPSTGLLLTLIWLGPTLVILARTRLRHRAN